MRSNKLLQIIAAGLLMTMLSVTPALAQWSFYSNINNTICTTGGEFPTIASDGSGGAIITWQDNRSGSNWDIYVQRVNALGAVQWTSNGVAIDTATGDQSYPTIVSDGSGGAIITWCDGRNGIDNDIYAQRVNASGVVQWTANGVAIDTATGDQSYPKIVSDGSGGAIITWQDQRSGNYDIYAQRVNASGAVQWTGNGVAIDTAAGDQSYPTIISDGAGGAIITWGDDRSGSSWDIYAQRVNASGIPQWTTNGIVVCTATGDQSYPTIVSDGSGGAIITWQDNRNGGSNHIYAQRVNASGAPQWTADGVPVFTATGSQWYPTIVSDGSSGAIITWYEYPGTGNTDIYAQRVNASGVVQWTANGAAICTAAGDQLNPTIVSDDSGGAIITWQDYRNGGYANSDIFAQRVRGSGTVQWRANGVPICTAAGAQVYPTIVSDGSGGAIITWNGVSAQWIDANASNLHFLPRITTIRDVQNDQGGKVRITWERFQYDMSAPLGALQTTMYGVWRKIQPNLPRTKTAEKPLSVLNDTLGLLYDFVVSVPAIQSPLYNAVVPTLDDSSSSGTSRFTFLITAHTSDPDSFFISNVDSGYSVDNLAPIAPQNAAILPMVNGSINIHWNPDKVDPDVGHFSVYRSTSSGFPLNDGTRLKNTVDTTVTDSTTEIGQQYYYRVTAVDIHGNESQPTAELHTAALSVQLASMTATTLTSGVQLDWTTVSETNSLGFYVERRVQNAGAYATVSDLIPGAGTSLQQHHYQWTDTKVTDGNYNYRLRLVDLSGTNTYSSAIAVTVSGVTGVNGSLPTEFALQQNYPNPFNPTTVMSYQLPVASYVTLKVYNMLGQEVATLVNGMEDGGWKSVVWDAANLPSGIYTYRLTARPTDGGQAGTYVEVKKMLMLK